VQPEEVVFSRFTNEFLAERNSDKLTVGQCGRWTGTVQGLLDNL
jgi:hypothetical protein